MSTPEDFNRQALKAGTFPEAAHDALLLAAVRDWQRSSELTPDGKFGPKSAAVWAEQNAPLGGAKPPRTVAQHRSFFGNPSYEERPRGRVKLDPNWVQRNIAYVKLHNGRSVRLHRKIAENFRATFERACKVSGYTPKSVQTFVQRHKGWNAKRNLSEHSYGAAIDFDPTRNAMGGRDNADSGPSLLRQHMDFVEVFEAAGWTWGGRWRMKDDMHFQYGSA